MNGNNVSKVLQLQMRTRGPPQDNSKPRRNRLQHEVLPDSSNQRDSKIKRGRGFLRSGRGQTGSQEDDLTRLDWTSEFFRRFRPVNPYTIIIQYLTMCLLPRNELRHHVSQTRLVPYARVSHHMFAYGANGVRISSETLAYRILH